MNAFGILVLVMAIFAIIGVSFFGEATPELFGTFGHALFTCFQLMTGDAWASEIGRVVIEKTHWTATSYFVIFHLGAGMVLVNVIVAVLLDKFCTDSDTGGGTLEEKQLEKMIDKMRQDREQFTADAVEALPDEVVKPVYSNAFKLRCLDRFKIADWDMSGYLAPDEIVDIVRLERRSEVRVPSQLMPFPDCAGSRYGARTPQNGDPAGAQL